MKGTYLVIVLILFLWGCKKSITASMDLSAMFQSLPTDSTDILGDWILIATRHYCVPANADTSWKQQDTTQSKIIVDFNSDYSFTYTANYKWQRQSYNRYNYLDTAFYANYPVFHIYSSQMIIGNAPNPFVSARQVNFKSMIITYMGVDAGDEELYYQAKIH
jgi:hypothetical protein